MAKLKELREKRAELGGKIQELRAKHSAETGWASPEDKANWEALNKDFDTVDAEVRDAKTTEDEAAAVASRLAQVAELAATRIEPIRVGQVVERARNMQEKRELAFQGWALVQYGRPDDVTDAHRQAARDTGCSLNNHEFEWKLGGRGRNMRGKDLSLREARAAMGVSVDTLGGFTVPEGFVANLEMALRAFGGIRNVADVMRTETAQPLPWPTIADTTPGSTDPVYGGSLVNVGEMLGENVATSLQGTPPAMGSVIFGAQKFSSKLFQISRELLRDSAFNLASVIGELAGERIARSIAQKCTTGSGNGIVPRGIAVAAPTPPAYGSLGTGVTTASSAGITFDDISNLVFSVDPAYRAGPGSGFLLHDKIVGLIRLLKDGVGRYLWSAGSVQTGEEPKIWDYPYQVSQEMPYDISGHYLDSTTTTGIAASTLNKIILFGQLSKYKIREVANLRMYRLVERFAEYDQDGFIGYMECDGDLIDAGTHPVGALAIHA